MIVHLAHVDFVRLEALLLGPVTDKDVGVGLSEPWRAALSALEAEKDSPLMALAIALEEARTNNANIDISSE